MNQYKSPPAGALAADIQTLWVAPEFRKQKIATTLKARGEAWAEAHNLSHISTFVHGKNSSMLSLNQNLGYWVL